MCLVGDDHLELMKLLSRTMGVFKQRNFKIKIVQYAFKKPPVRDIVDQQASGLPGRLRELVIGDRLLRNCLLY